MTGFQAQAVDEFDENFFAGNIIIVSNMGKRHGDSKGTDSIVRGRGIIMRSPKERSGGANWKLAD